MSSTLATTQAPLALLSATSLQLGQYLKTANGLTLVSVLAFLCLAAMLQSSGKAKLASGRWASAGEHNKARQQSLHQMRVRKYDQVALSIGPPHKPHTLHFPDVQRGFAVSGAPGSGKTFSIINPLNVSALLQGLPVILYDFKYPKQTSQLAPLAQHLGYDVHILAPGYPESDVCNLPDFMEDANDMAMSRQLAKVIYKNAERTDAMPRSEDSFFAAAGEQGIVGGLSLAKTTPYPDIMMVQSLLRLPDLTRRIEASTKIPLWSRVNFDQLVAVASSEKTAASIIGTAAGYFTKFMDPSLLAAFVGPTTLPLDLHGRQMVVLGLDKKRRETIGPLVASVLHMLIEHNMSQPRQTPLVVSLDELPSLYLPNLVQWINQYRNQGLCAILGFQNLAQLESTYGHNVARAIFGACATKALFNPGETESAQMFSTYLGDEEVRYTEISRSHNNGKTTINRSQQRRTRKLFESGQFLKLPTGSAIIISPGTGNRREHSIPVRSTIHVPTSVKRMLNSSARSWERLRQLLIQRSTQQPPSEADFQERIAHAESILPLP